MTKVRFRRINGRIVPIMARAAAGTGVVGGMAAVASMPSPRKAQSRTPSMIKLAAGYGLQVASGFIAAATTRTKLGLSMAVGGSIAADTASSAAFLSAASGIKGNKRAKLTQFAKHQAAGTALGYASFGTALLARRDVRTKVASWGAKLLRKVVL